METELPVDLTDANIVADTDLSTLEADLTAELDALLDARSDDFAAMTDIAAAIEAVRHEAERRIGVAGEADLARAELAARIHGTPDAEVDPDPEDVPAPDATPAGDAPTDVDADTRQPVTAAAPRAAAPPAPTRRPGPPSATGIANRAGRPNLPARASTGIVITAAADVPGHATGSRMNGGTLDIAIAFHEKARGLGDGGRASVARITVPTPAADQLDGLSNAQIIEVIERVANPDNLLVNGVVASGGWCAPTQVMYDFFSIEAADALFDLPTVGIERGGFNFPDFMGYTNAANALWTWTNADDLAADFRGSITNKALNTNVATLTTNHPHGMIVGDTVIVTGVDAVFNGTYTVTSVPTTTTFTYAKTNANVASVTSGGYYQDSTGEITKPCVRVDCPTFTEYLLGAEGLCVTHGNLSDRAWPELTKKFVSLVMTLHAHRVSNATLAKVIATAQAVTVTNTTSTDTPGDILSAIELQASDFRSQYLMSKDSVLEVVMPLWATGAIRASMAMRAGMDTDAMNITDAQIAQWFATRQVRAQFVLGYQPLYNATPTVAWPSVLKFLIYAAGSYVKGTGPVIDLGVLRDSVLNSTNDFTAAWSEQFYLVARRGPAAREVTVTISTDGKTAI